MTTETIIIGLLVLIALDLTVLSLWTIHLGIGIDRNVAALRIDVGVIRDTVDETLGDFDWGGDLEDEQEQSQWN